MRGEHFLIVKKVLEDEDCPIKEEISSVTPERIIDVIGDEYWKHFQRKLQFNTENCIVAKNLGSFYTDLSRLKGYIHRSVRKLRKLRLRLKKLFQDPKFDKEKSMTWLIERDLTRKVGIAWQQLDERRELMIMRYIRYNDRLRKKGEADRIKYNYEWYPFKFLKQYGYNNNIFKELVYTK